MADTKASALTALTGAGVDPVNDIFYIVDTSATQSKKITFDEALIGLLASTTHTRFKVGTFTYDLTTTSGTQAITGVGFAPKAVVFLAGINGSSVASWGIDDGTTGIGIGDDNADAAATYGIGTQASIQAYQATGGHQIGYITTLGADGFTITWTKTGAPSGTLTVGYLAFK